ncbi:MAG: hypothetical protein ACKOFI_05675, partial [Phycisphaerales bacterium]
MAGGRQFPPGWTCGARRAVAASATAATVLAGMAGTGCTRDPYDDLVWYYRPQPGSIIVPRVQPVPDMPESTVAAVADAATARRARRVHPSGNCLPPAMGREVYAG